MLRHGAPIETTQFATSRASILARLEAAVRSTPSSSELLGLHTATCRRLYHDILDPRCPRRRATAGSGSTREEICQPSSAAADSMIAASAMEYKLLPIVESQHRTPVFKAVHKVATTAVATKLRVNGARRTVRVARLGANCNASRLLSDTLNPLLFTIVRDPLARFVSAYNTILALENNHHDHQSGSRCETRLAQFVEGMLTNRQAASRRFRYDMHIASQMSELRCALAAAGQNDPVSSGAQTTPPPGIPPLSFVTKLESLLETKGALSGQHLPGYSIHPSRCRMGGSLPCALSSTANLSRAVIRQLCEYYAQDYVCLQYALPVECRAPQRARAGS